MEKSIDSTEKSVFCTTSRFNGDLLKTNKDIQL